MSTKFTLALLVLAISTVLLLFNKIDPETWGEINIWNAAIYGGGNVTATLAHSKR